MNQQLYTNQPSIAGKSFILRLEMDTDQVQFANVAKVIAEAGGDIIALDMIQTGSQMTVRDITVTVTKNDTIEQIEYHLKSLSGVRLLHISDRTFLLHLGGKVEISPKIPIQNRDDLSRVYTPDVARVCLAIQEQPEKAHTLTIKRNTVAVISDGSAVLGLGNIGASAAMPVMEGKALLFKQFAGIDAFPICLDTQDTQQIIETIKAMAPTFGGINLEDISSPRCFDIEKRLNEELDIPVFHDDQHGTAVVLLAGLMNAMKVVGKPLDKIRVVVCGIGAAGLSCTKMLMAAGVKNIIGYDKAGALTRDVQYDNPHWQWFAENTNPERKTGTIGEVLEGADVFIGLSRGGVLKREDVMKMASQPVVFAMANPDPEIHPAEIEDIAAVIATGRSDYPNQINNVLCFPGIFRGALDCRAETINEEMKLAAAKAIASVISDHERNPGYIIPSVFNQNVVQAIRTQVVDAAIRTGVARKIPSDFK
ncbi:malate dehydrogenase (oxaloacetate-decarboxylating) [Seinonella peptonophila]|uniref:Malate dehydrogenase (Oxaloacetate-decarboxylating) n=1 Tax=Seinonella peptonophila TaxID=112248 RepID=A0A1M5BD35_9BACL|nr:NAD-dependent malic enzyme [Seinonella peptonophila]SHF40389.1 malate dehydrogenase (oxaloacetate-decarboxylating) [Seinonella peptonophila]